MNKDDIKQLLLRGERITLECKEAQRTIPKSVWESYSAFANTIGGMILLGVKEDLKETDTARRFVITGVEDSRKMKKEFWDTLKTFLKNLAGYTIDRNTGREGLTVAGLLMFGKGLSISERFANFRMDYLDMTHLVGEERYSDRLTYDGRWENNLYQFFRIVMPKLTFDLPRPFKMEGIQRQDDTLQHKAVREAFTNAIIHSDVFVSGGILRIEKHDDCLVLRNPGTLKLPIAKIIAGGNSKARNPRMQNMLRMVGYGENIGSGFPKILNAWQKAGWNVPLLENKLDVQEVQLTMYIPKAHEQENEQENEQEEMYVDLTERQLVILNLIKDNPAISLEQMTKKAKVSMSTIRRDIKAMCHIVKRVGGDKGGHWEIIK